VRRFTYGLPMVLVLLCAARTRGVEGDSRLDDFESYIAVDTPRIAARHPSLLFGKEGIAKMRRQGKTPYFQPFVTDLVATADRHLRMYQADREFPYVENPNFRAITEAFVFAYLLTGEKAYADRAIGIAKTFIHAQYKNVPIRDSGKFVRHPARAFVSHYLPSLALIYDVLYDEMSADDHFLFRKGIAYHCWNTYDMAITEEFGLGFHKNYRAGHMGALGLGALVLEGETRLETHEWLDKAMRVSLAWCNVAIRADGMYPEGVTYYSYLLRNQTLFFSALGRRKGVDYFGRTNLPASLRWVVWSSLPWGREFDNFNDARYQLRANDYIAILQGRFPGIGDYLVQRINGGRLRYQSNPFALLHGRQPGLADFDPKRELGWSQVFSEAGMVAFRTGWDAQAMAVMAYATNYEYASHSQADRGQFNVYAYGRKWAIDSGYGNDAKIANSATPSAAHNLVLIDGKGQGFDRTMRQSGTFAEIEDFAAGDVLGYARINQKKAYDFFARYHYSQIREHNPVHHAKRHLLFVRGEETPPFLLVYDDIRKDDTEHTYTWQLHSDPANQLQLVDGHIQMTPLAYTGKTAFARGTGTWDKPIGAGFNMYAHQAGRVLFRIDAPAAGQYAFWALSRGRPRTWSNAEVRVNGQMHGRFELGGSREFHWKLFSANKKKMHAPALLDLKAGANDILLTGVFSGYEIARLLFTPDVTCIPVGDNPKQAGAILAEVADIAEHDGDIVVQEVEAPASSACSVWMLSPKKTSISFDHYQPSVATVHPRARVETKAVNPHFLSLVFPHKLGMPPPRIERGETPARSHASLEWGKVRDTVIVRTSAAPLAQFGVVTDAKLLFVRQDQAGRTLRLLAADATHLTFAGKTHRADQPAIPISFIVGPDGTVTRSTRR
jgi:hypothetical protein